MGTAVVGTCSSAEHETHSLTRHEIEGLINARERRLGIRRQKRAIDGDDAEILRDA